LAKKIENIAEKIIYAIENPDECFKMVNNGLKTVEAHNWEKRTDILEKVLFNSVKEYSFDQYKLFDDLSKGNLDCSGKNDLR
jgi:hypothetical protein